MVERLAWFHILYKPQSLLQYRLSRFHTYYDCTRRNGTFDTGTSCVAFLRIDDCLELRFRSSRISPLVIANNIPIQPYRCHTNCFGAQVAFMPTHCVLALSLPAYDANSLLLLLNHHHLWSGWVSTCPGRYHLAATWMFHIQASTTAHYLKKCRQIFAGIRSALKRCA